MGAETLSPLGGQRDFTLPLEGAGWGFETHARHANYIFFRGEHQTSNVEKKNESSTKTPAL